jgi:hypothetical protein
MSWGLVGSLALVAAGTAIVGRGLLLLVEGRVSFRGAADSWLIGLGTIVVGGAPRAPGHPSTVVMAGGMVLVLAGTLLLVRSRTTR